MIQQLFWGFIICIVVGSILHLFFGGSVDTERHEQEQEQEQEQDDPNIFYYEDLHDHDSYDDD